MLFFLSYDILILGGNMKNTKTMFKVDNNLKDNFNAKMKDEIFNKLVNSLKINQKTLYKHTSSLEDSCKEVENCLKCKGLSYCKNELKGYCNLPEVDNEDITFTYKACKYQIKHLKNNEYKNNLSLFDMPQNLKDAKMKDIYTDDKSRIEIIKYLDNYYKTY